MNVTPGLPSWPVSLQALAMVASPRLGLRQVPNQKLLLVQETFIPTKHANNPLPTDKKPIQLV